MTVRVEYLHGLGSVDEVFSTVEAEYGDDVLGAVCNGDRAILISATPAGETLLTLKFANQPGIKYKQL